MTPQELNERMKQYMKIHDNFGRDAYRAVLQEVRNIEINEQREATEEDVTVVIKRLLKQTNETLEASIQLDDFTRTSNLLMRVEILQRMLPAQLEGEELTNRIDELIVSLGVDSKKGIGKIMNILTQETNSNFDKASAGQYLNKIL